MMRYSDIGGGGGGGAGGRTPTSASAVNGLLPSGRPFARFDAVARRKSRHYNNLCTSDYSWSTDKSTPWLIANDFKRSFFKMSHYTVAEQYQLLEA